MRRIRRRGVTAGGAPIVEATSGGVRRLSASASGVPNIVPVRATGEASDATGSGGDHRGSVRNRCARAMFGGFFDLALLLLAWVR
jgi:hypothetical protein